jgi:hypothetical protein
MTQNQRVLEYIRTHGAITVAECSTRLNIFHLPRRIKDLEEAGYDIKRYDHRVYSQTSNKWTTITVYTLPKPKVKRKIDQLQLQLN